MAIRIKIEKAHDRALPLPHDTKFEAASVPGNWHPRSHTVPVAREWRPVPTYKADWVLRCAVAAEKLPVLTPILFTNAAGKKRAFTLTFIFDNIYKFNSRDPCEGMVMREAPPYDVIATMQQNGAYLPSSINIWHGGKKVLRALLISKMWIQVKHVEGWLKAKVALSKATPVRIRKDRHGPILSRKAIMYKGWPKPVRVYARKRERGQTLITDYFVAVAR